MAITIGPNINSLRAQRKLADVSSAAGRSYERLASGLRINRASDDPAGLAVSSTLSADSRVFTQGVRNANDVLSLLNIAQGALQELSSITVRQKELAQQAANGSFSLQQRRSLGTEANALVDEYNRIIEGTKFNGTRLLDKSIDSVRAQIGYGTDETVNSAIGMELDRYAGTGTPFTLSNFGLGSAAVGTATADFNHDGNADVTSVTGGGSLMVSLGTGSGTFGIALSIPVPLTPTAVATADFNGDGNSDIIVARTGTTGAFGVHLGNGDGNFQAGVTVGVVANSFNDVFTGDFNNDGYMDFVGAPTSANNVQVYLGCGNGSFKSPITTALGASQEIKAVADFNNDGALDIFVNGVNGTVLLGTGTGSFTVPASRNFGTTNADASAADLNLDGYIDLVTDGASGPNVFLNNGDGTFRMSSLSGNATGAGIKIADFNTDGIGDIVQFSATHLKIFIGNGDGTFTAGGASQNTGATSISGSAIADFNRDGVLDLFLTDGGTSVVRVLLQPTTLTTRMQKLNLTTQEAARASFSVLDDTLNRVQSELGVIGASQSRVDSAIAALSARRDNVVVAASRIVDADIANESADIVRTQILQKATQAVLSQANLQPQLALMLLKSG